MRAAITALAIVCAMAPALAETIDFEDIAPGTIVDEVFGDSGSGPIGLFASNPALGAGNNAAVIFDSSNPPGVDFDLGSPNQMFSGPGLGAAGQSGPFINDVALGHILIVNEAVWFVDRDMNGVIDNNDSPVVRTDDADLPNEPITFDFSAIGPVSITSMTLIDVEDDEAAARVELYDAEDNVLAMFALPQTGNNGVARDIDLGPTSNVTRMVVVLNGSGGIDSIVFDAPAPFCGDGNIDPGEQCDDGNNVDGDGCDADCNVEHFCGDGTLDPGEQCDDGNNVDGDGCDADCNVEAIGCRFTGGGVDTSGNWDHTLESGEMIRNGAGNLPAGVDRYTFGGQAGANTALPLQPAGEWTHHQQRGPSGRFTFHGGTSSAPAGTEIDAIRCSDPGFCNPARHAPAKQLDFDGVGTFKSIGSGSNAPAWQIMGANVTAEGNGNQSFDGTFHWFEVNIDDLGERGGSNLGAPNTETCPSIGFGEKGANPLANCECPDFYRITIYDGVDAADFAMTGPNKTDVIYEAYGYIDGGNLQIHPLTGFDSN